MFIQRRICIPALAVAAICAVLVNVRTAHAQTPGGGIITCRHVAAAAHGDEAVAALSHAPVDELTAAAWIRLSCGHYDVAEALYRRALALDPHNRDALMGLGILKLDQLDLDAARAAFTAVLERSPADADALRMLAEVRRRYAFRFEVAGFHERAGGASRQDRLFVGAEWRPAWNVALNAAYYQDGDIRFATSPAAALERIPGGAQGLMRAELKPSRFSAVGAAAYVQAGAGPLFNGAGIDGAVVLSSRIEALARADYLERPGGAVVVVSPAVIFRFREWRDAWQRAQYFHQDGQRGGARGAICPAPPTISSSASQPGVRSSREYARRSPSAKSEAGKQVAPQRWAHWCLTSESASLTLMNACRVTPSLRAS